MLLPLLQMTSANLSLEGKMLEMFEVGPCENGFQQGFLIGQRFCNQIRSRLAGDFILRNQLLPFAQTPQTQQLIKALSETNRKKFPRYWDELLGTAEGSGVPVLDIILVNFRKELLPFIPDAKMNSIADTADDCSDVLNVSNSMAVASSQRGCNLRFDRQHVSYLIKGKLSNGLSFTAYTYAGELPTCAFGFNSQGLAFTQNAVQPTEGDIVPAGIGRNFVSRDLLEATSIADSLVRIRSFEVSLGHNYNLIDIQRRQKRAAVLPKGSKDDVLSLLGDTEDPKYPIYTTGPHLYTLCTTVIDLDERTFTIMEGNPKKRKISHVFLMSSNEFNCELVNSGARTRL